MLRYMERAYNEDRVVPGAVLNMFMNMISTIAARGMVSAFPVENFWSVRPIPGIRNLLRELEFQAAAQH